MAKYVTEDNLVRYTGLLQTNATILKRGTAYTVGQVVQKGDVFLKCVTAGTTDTSVLTLSNVINTLLTDGTVVWQVIDPFAETKVRDWETGVDYEVGRIILYGGVFYRCLVTHTSLTTFTDPSEIINWEVVGVDASVVPRIPDWTSSKDYAINDTVMYEGNLYRCTNAHTSSSDFDTDTADWELIYASVSEWSAGTHYQVGSVVVNGGVLFQCTTANTDMNFDEDNWLRLSEEASILEWESGKFYDVGDTVTVNNVLYRCNTAHTSAGNFGADSFNTGYWDVLDASINWWTANIPYIIGDSVTNDYKLYRAINNSNLSSFSKFRWRPYVPVINEWQKYSADDTDGLLSYFKCNTIGDSFYDSMGNNVVVNRNLLVTSLPYRGIPYRVGFDKAAQAGISSESTTNSAFLFALDMRQWFPSATTAQDCLDAIIDAGGITLEYYYYYRFEPGGGQLGERIGFLSSSNSSNSNIPMRMSEDRYTNIYSSSVRASMKENWTHFSFNFYPFFDTATSSYKYYMYDYVNGNLEYTKGPAVLNVSSASFGYWFIFSLNVSLSVSSGKANGVDDIRIYLGRKRTSSFTPPDHELDTDNARPYGYVEGEFVIKDHKLYRCTEANMDTSWTPEHWEAISVEGGGIEDLVFDWDVAINYVVGNLAVYNGKLYRCNTDHTSVDFTSDISNWDLISGSGGGIEEWTTTKDYDVDDLVLHNGSIFKCVNSHTSSSFDTDVLNWEIVTADIKEWQTSTFYATGVIVINDSKLYKCTTDHTSDSTSFITDIANWELIGSDVSFDIWATSTNYEVGNIVLYNDNIYRCKTAHTSSSSFDTSKFDIIFASIKEWQTTTAYKVGSVVINDGKIYKCNTTHSSSASSFNTDIANWDLLSGGGAGLEDWQASHSYSVDDIFVYNGQVYRVVTAFTSGSTFSETSDIEKYVPKPLTSTQIQDIVDEFTPIGSGKALPWAANTEYVAGQIVTYDGVLYVVDTDFTSGSTFSDSNMTEYGGIDLDSTEIQAIIDAF